MYKSVCGLKNRIHIWHFPKFIYVHLCRYTVYMHIYFNDVFLSNTSSLVLISTWCLSVCKVVKKLFCKSVTVAAGGTLCLFELLFQLITQSYKLYTHILSLITFYFSHVGLHSGYFSLCWFLFRWYLINWAFKADILPFPADAFLFLIQYTDTADTQSEVWVWSLSRHWFTFSEWTFSSFLWKRLNVGFVCLFLYNSYKLPQWHSGS